MADSTAGTGAQEGAATTGGDVKDFHSSTVQMDEGSGNSSARPEWLPEGVEKVEDLKAYFEAKQAEAVASGTVSGDATTAASTSDTTLGATEGNDSVAGDTRTDDEIIAELNKAGGIYADPKYQPHALTFEKTGDLTPEQRQQAATDLGIGLDYVNAFVDNAKLARAAAPTLAEANRVAIDNATETARGEIHAVAGGAAEFAKFQAWSADGLSKAEADAFNNADVATAKVLLAGYMAKYRAAGNGAAARDLTAEGTRQTPDSLAGGAQAYQSKAEMTKDMADPRYARDPAFRNAVIARVKVSDV